MPPILDQILKMRESIKEADMYEVVIGRDNHKTTLRSDQYFLVWNDNQQLLSAAGEYTEPGATDTPFKVMTFPYSAISRIGIHT